MHTLEVVTETMIDSVLRNNMAMALLARIREKDDQMYAYSISTSIWANNKYSLTLEITEGGLVVDSASNFSNLSRLRNAGIGISIDDFGT
jgi:predicted signal transduction protein with EAL and GGDEF domain